MLGFPEQKTWQHARARCRLLLHFKAREKVWSSWHENSITSLMMRFFSSVLSETSPCVVGVCSCRLWCYLCWCFLLFIFWTGGERVFTLVAIKRTVSQRMMMMMVVMMMITTNYSHWLQQGLTPSDRLPHGFFRQTSIGAASEARCLSLSDWIVIWCIYNCAMYVIHMRDMLSF